MDTVRKLEQQENKTLKKHKYTFLKDWDRLSDKRRRELVELMDLYPTLGEAYRLKALFNDLWEMPNRESAEAHFHAWSEEVSRSGIQPFMQFAKTVKAHWSGIVRFVESRLTNGLLEGINHKIQLAKRRARGYRNVENFINMAYFLCGKLDFSFPRWPARRNSAPTRFPKSRGIRCLGRMVESGPWASVRLWWPDSTGLRGQVRQAASAVSLKCLYIGPC